MERLTPSTYSSLAGAYSAVYNEDLRSELNEEQQVQEFLQVIDALLEEGYDLSEYTYDELYENWKQKVVQYAAQTGAKYGPRALETLKKGVKGVAKIPVTGTKEIVKAVLKPLQTKMGAAAATLAGAEAALAGEKSLTRKALGKAGEGIQSLGRAIYGDGSAQPAPAQPPTEKPISLPAGYKMVNGKVVKEEVVIVKHLLDEGYATTEQQASAIAANMSVSWKQTILGDAE
jgi:hypothetical protein